MEKVTWPVYETPPKPPKKRKRNTDAKEISIQPHEIYYVSGTYNIPPHVIRGVIKEIGNSRKRVYAVLRERGYEVGSPAKFTMCDEREFVVVWDEELQKNIVLLREVPF